jgi:hypothetical protein
MSLLQPDPARFFDPFPPPRAAYKTGGQPFRARLAVVLAPRYSPTMKADEGWRSGQSRLQRPRRLLLYWVQPQGQGEKRPIWPTMEGHSWHK